MTQVDYDKPTTLAEPPNGSLVIIEEASATDDGEGVEYSVIWRDDALATKYAAEGGAREDQRWFSDPEDDGRTWVSALRYADGVHVLLNPAASRVEVTR